MTKGESVGLAILGVVAGLLALAAGTEGGGGIDWAVIAFYWPAGIAVGVVTYVLFCRTPAAHRRANVVGKYSRPVVLCIVVAFVSGLVALGFAQDRYGREARQEADAQSAVWRKMRDQSWVHSVRCAKHGRTFSCWARDKERDKSRELSCEQDLMCEILPPERPCPY